MANQQGNFGFRPVQMLGGAYNGQGQQEVSIASNETNSIFQGMPGEVCAKGGGHSCHRRRSRQLIKVSKEASGPQDCSL